MPTVQQIWQDKDFHSLAPEEKSKVMARVDPDFAVLPPSEQAKVISKLSASVLSMAPAHTPGERVESIGTKTKRIVREHVEPIARPTLSGGMSLVGGAVGLASPLPGGTIIGGTLGYAAGQQAGDILFGERGEPTLGGQAKEVGQDLYQGALGEAMGLGLGAGISTTARGAKAIASKGLPFSDKAARVQAGRAINQVRQPITAQAVEQEAKNLSKAEGLKTRTGITEPTFAQKTGSVTAGAFEQSRAAKFPEVAARLKYKDADINLGAITNIKKFLGETQPPIIAGSDKQGIGARTIDELSGAKAKVVDQEQQIWGGVPQHEIPTPTVEATIQELNKTPMEKTVKKTVSDVTAYIKALPKTTQGLQAADRTIQARIREASRMGRNDISHELGKLKDALESDFKLMGDAADAGDVALYNGKLVYPGKLQSELTDIVARIAEGQNKITPDIPAIQKALTVKGIPSMRQVNESETAFTKRITDSYIKNGLGDIPVASTKQDADLAARSQQIQKILANTQPADDVAKAYKTAKQFSKEQKFDKFGRGAVKDVLKRGDEYSGYQLPMESIPRNFATPTGADDLIRAIGRQKAAPIMSDYAKTVLSEKALDSEGNIIIPRAMAFLRQNGQILDKYGIRKDFERIIKDSVPDALYRTIEKASPDVLGNPKTTIPQIQRMMRDFGPALRYLYREQPGAYQSLKDYQEIITMLARNKNVSYASGSTTQEKGFGDLIGNIGQLGAISVGKGWIFSSSKNIISHITRWRSLVEGHYKKINDLLNEAIFNPELADDLMKIAKTADSTKPNVKAFFTKWLPTQETNKRRTQ